MAKDALRCFLESVAKEKASIPKDIVPRREKIAVYV